MKLFLLLLGFTFLAPSSSTKFVLVGSLGDLAKKYLWNAINKLDLNNNGDKLEIFGASRNAPSEGGTLLNEILGAMPESSPDYSPEALKLKLGELIEKLPKKGIELLSQGQDQLNDMKSNLPTAISSLKDSFSRFISSIPEKSAEIFADSKEKLSEFLNDLPDKEEKLANFVSSLPLTTQQFLTSKSDELNQILETLVRPSSLLMDHVKYLQLKKEEDYADFCSSVTDETVIFYLSIPPSAYIPTTEMISRYCTKETVEIRIAYEKPFGYDFASAKDLFTSIDKLVPKESVYLIDHYLGKGVTQAIVPIRRNHDELESLLNKDHVSSIQVNLLERVDCKGRAGYYDKSGVIRDMLQNHATELLSLITADLAQNTELSAAKQVFLQSLSLPNKHQVVVAQYDKYSSDVGSPTTTPTYAAVLFTSNLTRWEGVPIVLTSGKSQAHQRKDIVVKFKSGGSFEVRFNPPGIMLKGANLLPEGFVGNSNSYIALLKAVISGKKELLPSMDTVLASWNVWEPLLTMNHNLLIHSNLRNMAVERRGKFLVAVDTENPLEEEHVRFFNKAFMIGDHEEHIYDHVAQDIVRVAEATLKEGSAFHLALSGGSSVLGLFKYLLGVKLDWSKTHIWQVDERCDVNYLNAANLRYFLLDHVKISPSNLHLMPVTEKGCGDVAEYQMVFERYCALNKFHYVLLGLGNDGHTASHFQQSRTLAETPNFKHVEVDANVVSPKRMTISFDLINRSEWVSILVVGKEKREVIQSIKNGDVYPVSRVSNSQLTWFIDEVLL